MAATSLLLASATDQGRLIAAGTVDAADLLRQQLDAIAEANPRINAFVKIIEPELPETSGNAASPLTGTCFAVKDNIDVRGVASHSGMRALRAQPALQDARVVGRLRAAGLQCIGKLNMHPMALGATNHNADFGNCYNPRRAAHTPGGSSGGSGAAVAAGLCGIALGTDTMGSVRIPAAYCGVVGFKASFESIATDGVMPLCRALDHVGILARSVEDVINVFRLIGDASEKLRSANARGASGASTPLRFAIPADLDALGLAPEVRMAFVAAIEQLRGAGIVLDPIYLGAYPFTRARRAGLLLSEAELLNTLAVPLAQARNEMPADMLAMLDYAAQAGAAGVARALSVVVEAGTWLHRAMLPFDALLMPTAAQTAFAMDAPVPPEQADFTAMANMTGGPAISLPLPLAPEALPVGLQLMGRRGEDWPLLDAAIRVEALLR